MIEEHMSIWDEDNVHALQNLLSKEGCPSRGDLIFEAASTHAPKCLAYLLETHDGSPIYEEILLMSLPTKCSNSKEELENYKEELVIEKILIEKGNFPQEKLEMCLLHALRLEEEEIAELLISKGARPEIRPAGEILKEVFNSTAPTKLCESFDPTTPLAEFLLPSLCDNFPQCAEILLKRGVKPIGEQGEIAVRLALRQENKPLFELLRQKGAPCDILAEELAMLAARDNQTDCLLLNLALCNNTTGTASMILRVHTATISPIICQILLDHGADPSPEMGNPLAKAARAGNIKVMDLLLQNGALPKSFDAFREACMANQIEAVKLLQEKCPLQKEDYKNLFQFLNFAHKQEEEASKWLKAHAV